MRGMRGEGGIGVLCFSLVPASAGMTEGLAGMTEGLAGMMGPAPPWALVTPS